VAIFVVQLHHLDPHPLPLERKPTVLLQFVDRYAQAKRGKFRPAHAIDEGHFFAGVSLQHDSKHPHCERLA